MKTLTTTMMKTMHVDRFSIRFNLKCLLSSFRFHRTVDEIRFMVKLKTV